MAPPYVAAPYAEANQSIAMFGSIPNVMGMRTTIAGVPLGPGMAPKIIPIMLPDTRRIIPGHLTISASSNHRSCQSSKKNLLLNGKENGQLAVNNKSSSHQLLCKILVSLNIFL